MIEIYLAVLGTIAFILWVGDRMGVFGERWYFFKKRLAVDFATWDMLFKRFKIMEEREEVRRQYDALSSKLEIKKTEIEEEAKPGKLKDTSPGDYARFEDEKIRLERDIERSKQRMNVIDGEIHGLPASADYPDGVSGVNQQLDALRELKVLIRKYIKQR